MKTKLVFFPLFFVIFFLLPAGTVAQHLIVGNGSAVVLRGGAYMSVDMLKVSPEGTVYVDEVSVLQTSSTPRVTGVPTHESQTISPNTFALLQNFPNPFNPSTVISFSVPPAAARDLVSNGIRDGQLPLASSVTLKVYTALGEEVATLVNVELPPGTYRTTWNATGLPSGTYFYRLQAGAYTETKKLILLR